MTRKSKPPTNREMREVAESNIVSALDARCSNFDAALRAYEDALTIPGTDQPRLSELRRNLVAQFDSANIQLGYLARIRFVERYPDNDEPVKDA